MVAQVVQEAGARIEDAQHLNLHAEHLHVFRHRSHHRQAKFDVFQKNFAELAVVNHQQLGVFGGDRVGGVGVVLHEHQRLAETLATAEEFDRFFFAIRRGEVEAHRAGEDEEEVGGFLVFGENHAARRVAATVLALRQALAVNGRQRGKKVMFFKDISHDSTCGQKITAPL